MVPETVLGVFFIFLFSIFQDWALLSAKPLGIILCQLYQGGGLKSCPTAGDIEVSRYPTGIEVVVVIPLLGFGLFLPVFVCPTSGICLHRRTKKR